MVFDSPFAIRQAADKPSITICCEHGGQRRPAHWVLNPAEERILQDHWGWDPGASALSLQLAETLEADAIIGNWSRLVADLNRPPEHPELCRERAEDIDLSFNQSLSATQRKARVDGIHAPYTISAQAAACAIRSAVCCFERVQQTTASAKRRAGRATSQEKP